MDGEPAIRFADLEVLRVLTTGKAYINDNGSDIGFLTPIDEDDDGMITAKEVARVKSLSNRTDRNNSIFKGNTKIETFNEFRFFTSLNIINPGCFQDCSSLKEVTLPVLTRMGSSVFASSGIERLVIPEGYLTIGSGILQRCPNLKIVDFPSTVTSISEGGSLFWAMKNQAIVICRATTPPAFGGWGYDGDPKAIYVPDKSVDAYKSSAGWSAQATKIYPLSTYVEP